MATIRQRVYRRRARPEDRFLNVAADILWEGLVLLAIGTRGLVRLMEPAARWLAGGVSRRVRSRLSRRRAASAGPARSSPGDGRARRVRPQLPAKPAAGARPTEAAPADAPADEQAPSLPDAGSVERVGFADVIGLEDVKEEVRMKAIWPLLHPHLAAQYGLTVGGGVLLYGPPGTGKTLLARAVANEVHAPNGTAVRIGL